MASSPTSKAKDHREVMLAAAKNVFQIADAYINSYAQAKKSLFGKSHNCQKEASVLKSIADTFLKEGRNDPEKARTTYFFFIRDFIETYNSIPRNDSLCHNLQKGALNQFQMSLNTLLQLRSENTSQEFLAPYIILVKEKLRITPDEERNSDRRVFDRAG
ncbi:MAG: hypothetical protein P4M14_11565 [Gammaproteobacteria bacterium]|nr:hypothetical protein [Gammaproteobacteria bacterium]